jgi:peptide/nickel transport system permease protein
MRRTAWLALGIICVVAILAPWIAPHGYDQQFREFIGTAASGQFPMGTDEIGRDRLSRLLYATRVSIALAPAAAAVSIGIGLFVSLIALRRNRSAREALSALTTISLSLPWIFLFVIMRAELPLNTGPAVNMILTFGLMGVAGWAWAARVFTASFRTLTDAEWLLQARASGMMPWRIGVVHLWPHIRVIAGAQFRVLIPAYILAEASLGLLGLGVAEPLPSWGNLLRDLQHPDVVRANGWTLAPLGLLMVVMICLEVVGGKPDEVPA